MRYPIADLHCDLLCYLSCGENRTPFDAEVRCSIPQLQDGEVKFQMLAVYTPTDEKSVESGLSQVEQFRSLLENYSDYIALFPAETPKINVGMAIENASSLFAENESIELGFSRIKNIENEISKLAYLSFTWNSANRFGGGAHTKQGITDDGKALLAFMNCRKIAVDLSHASDILAFDILNEIDRKNYDIPVIASHSNARAITDAVRNLPDELIREIINRDGLIGFNFVRLFLDSDGISGFSRHLSHFLELGAADHLCFGADFFYGLDVPVAHQKPVDDLFFPDFSNASVYPKVIDLWKNELKLHESLIKKIASENLFSFLENKIYGNTRKTSSRC